MAISNRILTGLFLLPLVILGLNYGALYVKYKNDDYITERKLREEQTATTALPAFSRIDLSGYGYDAVRIQQGEPAISYHKNAHDLVQFEVKDQTLYVKTTADGYHGIKITCASLAQLTVARGVEIVDLPLQQCTVTISGENASLGLQTKANTLAVSLSNNASFKLEAGGSIGLLHLEMNEHTAFSVDPSGSINQFGKVQVADSVHIQMDGKTFSKLLAQP